MRRALLILVTLAPGAVGTTGGLEPAVEVCRDAIQPQVAIDADGGIHVTFIHRGNICVAVSQDRGKTFSPPVIAIDVNGKAAGGSQRGPRIGVDAQRRLVVTAPVVFDAAELEKRYPTAELYLARSGDGGKTWSRPLQVNEVAKKAPESLHWLAVSPQGDALVSWLDLRARLEPGQDLYLARVTGNTVGRNDKVADGVCECCAPGLAVTAAGLPVIAWRDGGARAAGRDILLRAASSRDELAPARKLNGAATNLFG
jgi:hypothetical protein